MIDLKFNSEYFAASIIAEVMTKREISLLQIIYFSVNSKIQIEQVKSFCSPSSFAILPFFLKIVDIILRPTAKIEKSV